MTSIGPWLGVARAPFLALPLTLVASGAAAAAYDGRASWTASILAAIGLVALHAAVNAFNEASDFRTRIDFHTERTPFSGGSGTLPSGALPRRAALAVGWGGTLVGAALVQDGRIGPAAWAASVPAFWMTFNLLLLNEFPDEVADRAGGRRNLVLVLGRRGAALVYAFAALATPASIVVSVALGALPPVALVAVLPSLALAGPLSWAFRRSHEPVPVPALGANVVWNLATNSVLAAALLYAAWQGGR